MSMSQKIGAPKPGHGRLVVFAEKSNGFGGHKWEMKLDEAPMGDLRDGTYVYADRPVGIHHLTASETLFPGMTERDVKLESGRTYFIVARASERAKTSPGDGSCRRSRGHGCHCRADVGCQQSRSGGLLSARRNVRESGTDRSSFGAIAHGVSRFSPRNSRSPQSLQKHGQTARITGSGRAHPPMEKPGFAMIWDWHSAFSWLWWRRTRS